MTKRLLKAIEHPLTTMVGHLTGRLLRLRDPYRLNIPKIAELIFALCEAKHIEVVILNKGDEVSFEEELAQDVLEIITVFFSSFVRQQKQKNKRLVDAAKVLIGDDK